MNGGESTAVSATSQASIMQPPAQSATNDGETRRRIMLLLLENRPMTAALIADHLGLTAAGVRRHLDIMVSEGLAEPASPSKLASRGRGRPARAFSLTDQGRAMFGHTYDSLAVSALEALREAGGEAAVTAFARRRVKEILAGIQPVSEAGNPRDTQEVVSAVVTAFRRHGYAASVNESTGAVQICQHHCPISNVAQDFPELCAAEHEIVSSLLGQHTQPLATIADGNGICTTNIPLIPVSEITKHTHDERSEQ